MTAVAAYDDDAERGGSSSPSGLEYDSFLSALERNVHTYDENMYYACKEYLLLHELNHKKHGREVARELIQINARGVPLSTRTYLLLRYENPFASRSGICYFAVQTMLAVASICALSFESSPEFNGDVFPAYRGFWVYVDLPVAVLLSLDIVSYFVILPQTPSPYSNGVCRRNFPFQFRFWVDVCSTAPTFLTYLQDSVPFFGRLAPLKVLRVLRLFRALRVLHSVDVLLHTLERSIAPLLAPLALFIGIVLFFSAAIFYAERGSYDPLSGQFLTNDCNCEMSTQYTLSLPEMRSSVCPLVRSPFISIPHTMWYVVVTLVTVGYGDMVPYCGLGRVLATTCMFLGSVVIAMPIAIVGMYYTGVVLADSAGQRKDPRHAFGRSNPTASLSTAAASSATSGSAIAAWYTRRQQFYEARRAQAAKENGSGDDGTSDEEAPPAGKTSSAEESTSEKVPSIAATQKAAKPVVWDNRPTFLMSDVKTIDPASKVLEFLQKMALAQSKAAMETSEAVDTTSSATGRDHASRRSASSILSGQVDQGPAAAINLVSPDPSVITEVNVLILQLFRHFYKSNLCSRAGLDKLEARLQCMSQQGGIRLMSLSAPVRSVVPRTHPLTGFYWFLLSSESNVSTAVLSDKESSWLRTEGRSARQGVVLPPAALSHAASDGAAAAEQRGGISTGTAHAIAAAPSISCVSTPLRMCAPLQQIPDVGICPSAWAVILASSRTGAVWLTPLVPRLDVDDEPLLAGQWRQLLVGDVVKLFRRVAQADSAARSGETSKIAHKASSFRRGVQNVSNFFQSLRPSADDTDENHSDTQGSPSTAGDRRRRNTLVSAGSSSTAATLTQQPVVFLGESTVLFEFLRVDSGAGVPPVDVADYEEELRLLPTMESMEREDTAGFILIEPVAESAGARLSDAREVKHDVAGKPALEVGRNSSSSLPAAPHPHAVQLSVSAPRASALTFADYELTDKHAPTWLRDEFKDL